MIQAQKNTSSSEFMPPPLIPTDIDSHPGSAAAAHNRADFTSEAEAESAPRTQAAESSDQEAQQNSAAEPEKTAKQEGAMPQNSTAHAENTEEANSKNAQNESDSAESAAEQAADQPEDTAEPTGNTARKGEDAEQAGGTENKEIKPPSTAADDSAEEHFPTAEEIRQAIYDVVDPEINISIIDLGLVYDIIPNPEDRTVHINMTLTSPGCPLGPEITAAVYLKVTRIPGVRDCQVDLVWSPMWDPMVHPTEETRMALGIW